MSNVLPSKLVKSQKRVIGPIDVPAEEFGKGRALWIEVRWDDQCGNKHNTFSVTGYVKRKDGRGDWDVGGCIHEIIQKYGPPEVSKLIKWHLMGSDGPMHYIANTTFWLDKYKAGGDNDRWAPRSASACLAAARACAMLEPGEQFPEYDQPGTANWAVEKFLEQRLQGLMMKFRADIEAFGFTY